MDPDLLTPFSPFSKRDTCISGLTIVKPLIMDANSIKHQKKQNEQRHVISNNVAF